jgi:hypothetical protein
MKENEDNQRRLKGEAEHERLEVYVFLIIGYQNAIRICKITRRIVTKTRSIEKIA